MSWTTEPAKCNRCKSVRPAVELNHEASMHHNARALECIDRKACERRKRKDKR